MPKKKKVGRPTNRSRAGRPLIITPEVLAKLEQAFSMGCTDLEACGYADISTASLYKYQIANPEFIERKERLKSRPVLKARTAIVNSFNEIENAWKYLERKSKDEFAPPSSKMDVNANIKGAIQHKIEVEFVKPKEKENAS
jgi:hypothetical protein